MTTATQVKGARRLRLGEALVGLAVLVVLVALLLPAKQAARESARKSAMRNEMMQSELRARSVRDGTSVGASAPARAPEAPEVMKGMMGGMMPTPPADAAPAPAQPAAAPVAPAQRKIITTADVELNVADFDRAARSLERLVKAGGGYFAETNVAGQPGVPRSGRWKVRVPVAEFDGFLDGVVALGELVRRQTTAQDVTEEYHDLDARLKNKKVEEARLLKHLEQSTATLKDTLDVERELSRVREEIERQQGRLQLLENLATLTTVTVTLNAVEKYEAETEPTFATSVGRTFRGSLGGLRDFGEAVVLAVVALAPWTPLIALVGWLLWRVGRRVTREFTTRPAPAAVTPAPGS